jgi:hypothetical protein
MSAFSDAMAALKNVVLMQERLELVRNELSELAGTVEKVQAYAVSLDKRLIRIETLAEVAAGRAAAPRLEQS